MALQHALAVKGHYTNEVDGVTGPATRAAIRNYADRYGLEPFFWPVAGHIARNLSWELDWNDRFENAVHDTLRGYLLDVESARVDERRAFVLPKTRGAKSEKYGVCVRVNAKNRFGAYVGYQWIYMAGFSFNILDEKTVTLFPPIDYITQEDAITWCALGYVMLNA